MNNIELSSAIESLLFALGRPLSREELSQKLSAKPDALEEAIIGLTQKLQGGVVLVDDGRLLELRVSSKASELIERIRKEEYTRDIGKAGLEALAAILYRGPLTRSEIDFIRGVNSTQTLRTLSMRGLVRKIPNPKDERSYLYEPTTELLAQLGVSRRSELPEFDLVREKLETLESAYRTQSKEEEK